MVNLHEFEINIPSHPGGDFFVKMDGQEIHGIRNIIIEVPLLEPPVIKLEILARSITGHVVGIPEITEVNPQDFHA